MMSVTRTLSPRRTASRSSRPVWARIIRPSGAATDGVDGPAVTDGVGGVERGEAVDTPDSVSDTRLTRSPTCPSRMLRFGRAVAGQTQEHLFERLPPDP